MPAPGGGKHEEVSGVAPGTACAVTMTSFLKMLLLRERLLSVWCQGAERCYMGQKSLLVIPDEPFSVLPLLLGWLYLPGYGALHPGFAKWLSSCLHLFILYLPLWKAESGRVQPVINDSVGIFLSG